MHLLFVCRGNICRSPVAERLTAMYAARAGVADLLTSSAGTEAVASSPMNPQAARVLRNYGGEPAGFLARQLDAGIAEQADLILTMNQEQRNIILALAPHKQDQTFTFGEAAVLISRLGAKTVEELPLLRPHLARGQARDIADPIGRVPQFFDFVGDQIDEHCPAIVELCRRSMISSPTFSAAEG